MNNQWSKDVYLGSGAVITPKFQHVLLKELHNDQSGISQTRLFACRCGGLIYIFVLKR